MEKEYTNLQMLAAKHTSHLSNENIKTMSLLAAVKLSAKNFYEHEQKIKSAEGKLYSTTLLIFLLILLVVL